VGGDNFGMDNDDFNHVPSNISTVADLLDTKGISWGEYQEDMPYPGYVGFNFTNQQNTSHNDYVRKHNPLIIYDSVASNATRLSLIKNFTSFESDLAAKTLPQWSFMTPNMTNDGHDTTITFTANWYVYSAFDSTTLQEQRRSRPSKRISGAQRLPSLPVPKMCIKNSH
jgi:acid phosphatase